MFFDAERDRDVVKYLDDRTGSDGIGSSWFLSVAGIMFIMYDQWGWQ
jgi:hypothetical protein